MRLIQRNIIESLKRIDPLEGGGCRLYLMNVLIYLGFMPYATDDVLLLR